MGRYRARLRRRRARPIRMLLALWAGLLSLAAALPIGAPLAAAAVHAARVDPVKAAAPAEVPAPCPGCRGFVLDVPSNPPANSSYNGVTNATTDLLVTLPSGWSSVVCGDKFGVTARSGTDLASSSTSTGSSATAAPAAAPSSSPQVPGEEAQGQIVTGWRCEVPALNQLRFFGPAVNDVGNSPNWFLFRALPPGPMEGLPPNLIDIVQTYPDGEQQSVRGVDQFEAHQPALSSNVPQLTLPPDWVPFCGNVVTGATAAAVGHFPVSGVSCTTTEAAGDHPRFQVSFSAGGTTTSSPTASPTSTAAQYYYFDAYSPAFEPDMVPFDHSGLTVRDLNFINGWIETEPVAYLRAARQTASPAPTAATLSCPNGVAYGSNNLNGINGIGGYGGIGGVGGYGGVSGYGGGYPYGGIGGTNGLTGVNGGFGTSPFGVATNSPTLSGTTTQSCNPPPPVIIDPCYGAAFTERGELQFHLPYRDRSPQCEPAVAVHNRAGGLPPFPPGGPGTAIDSDGRPCVPIPGGPIPAGVPAGPPPPDLNGQFGYGDRANRGIGRRPLGPVVGPTSPPVVLVDPAQGNVPPGQGVQPGAEANLVAPPQADPAPTIQALLPQAQPGVGGPAASRLPYCQDVLSLTDSAAGPGAQPNPLLRSGLVVSAIGTSGAIGAIFWRRRGNGRLRYPRR